jgi:translation elongation factor EF-G
MPYDSFTPAEATREMERLEFELQGLLESNVSPERQQELEKLIEQLLAVANQR